MTGAVVSLVSAATLAFQVLLVRLFAIEQFHHLASMAIGIAMLGSGVTGTAVALGGRLEPERARRWLGPATVAAAVGLVLGPALADRVTVDPGLLPWRAAEWGRLGLTYLALSLPFALGALPVLLALAAEPARPGRIYGASFAGSGLGAVGALAALAAVEPARALVLPSVVAAAAGGLGVWGGIGWRRFGPAAVAGALALGALAAPPWRVDVTPYKALPQIDALPGSERLAAASGPLGWVVAARAPGFRHAPGLSLAYRGPVPPAIGILVDGDLAAATVTPSDSGASVLGWLPAALPYAIAPPRRVLVLGAGTGLDLPAALLHGAESITVVELNPDVARLADSLGALPPGRVRWVVGDARATVARLAERYDLIVVNAGGGPGVAAAGTLALREDYLHTVEAYAGLLRRLAPGGMLAATAWLEAPPRAAPRAILTAAAALRRLDSASAGLLVVRSWATATVLARPAGFADADVAAARAWAASRWFDVDWPPADTAAGPGFNLLDGEGLAAAARAAAAGPDAAAAFAAAHPFRVEPVSDARPFPHHYLRPGAVRELVSRPRGEWLPVAEWGYLTLVATLLQSAALAALLLLAPTAVRAGRPPGAGAGRMLAYFGALGLGYLAAEVGAIQLLVLPLGHPIYAVSTVLAVVLVGSGAGSWLSDRVSAGRAPRVALALGAALGLAAALGLPLAHAIEGLPLAARAGAATLALVPVAVLLGMPFPLGLRTWAGGGGPRVAWAWAANGFASVVAAPLAALISLEASVPALLLVAAALYLAAALVIRTAGAMAPAAPAGS